MATSYNNISFAQGIESVSDAHLMCFLQFVQKNDGYVKVSHVAHPTRSMLTTRTIRLASYCFCKLACSDALATMQIPEWYSQLLTSFLESNITRGGTN